MGLRKQKKKNKNSVGGKGNQELEEENKQSVGGKGALNENSKKIKF